MTIRVRLFTYHDCLWHISNIPPVTYSLKALWLLGALDNSGKLTQPGREMAAFPLEPQYACTVVASKNYGCTSEVIDIVSVVSASSKLFLDISDQRDAATEVRRKFRHASGDHMMILNIVRAYNEVTAEDSSVNVVSGPGSNSNSGNNKDKAAKREWCRKNFLNERALLEAKDIRDQLRTVCERVNIDWTVSASSSKKSTENKGRTEEDAVVRSFGHGLAANSAFLQPDGSYKQTMGPSVSFFHQDVRNKADRIIRRLSKYTQVRPCATRRCLLSFTMNWYAPYHIAKSLVR